MTIETDAAPGAAAGTPAPEQNAISEGLANPAEKANEPTEADPPETEQERAVRKLERRVGTVTRQRYDAEARARQAEERAQRLEAQMQEWQQRRTESETTETQGEKPRQQGMSREEIEAEITRQADLRARVADTNRRANEIAAKGQKAFGAEFMEGVQTVMAEAGPLYGRDGLPTALGEAIQEAEDPAALLHFLGQNPDDAAELRGLSAAAIGRRIAKLEDRIAAQPASKPAKPLTPVTSKGNPKPKSDQDMTDAEWYAARRKK